jgi:hypothetical protein
VLALVLLPVPLSVLPPRLQSDLPPRLPVVPLRLRDLRLRLLVVPPRPPKESLRPVLPRLPAPLVPLLPVLPLPHAPLVPLRLLRLPLPVLKFLTKC